jgi:hypothetical protein
MITMMIIMTIIMMAMTTVICDDGGGDDGYRLANRMSHMHTGNLPADFAGD